MELTLPFHIIGQRHFKFAVFQAKFLARLCCCLKLRFFMGAGNSARQFSNVGLCFSRLPSTQKSGFLPTTLGGLVDLQNKISDFSVQNRILSF